MKNKKKLYSIKLNKINNISLSYYRKQHMLSSLVHLILWYESKGKCNETKKLLGNKEVLSTTRR
jgi:hypothetical protein